MRMSFAAAALAAMAVLVQDAPASHAQGVKSGAPVVVELFTSQGCSSCPPADAFLGELAQRRDVIALAFHVDYWDYIGWKDPFASPESTQRQRGYARALDLRTVYTPQMVIDGRADAVGSHRMKVEELIRRSSYQPKLPLELDMAGSKPMLRLPQAALDAPAAVWLAIYDREERTAVRRGENAGRNLSEYNIVRELRKLASWDGAARQMELDLSDIAEGMAGAILIQSTDQGPILAALEVPPAALQAIVD